MERASTEGQKNYLLKCLNAELGERMLAITDATTPILDTPGNPTKSCFTLLTEEFHRRFPVTHRQAQEHGCRSRSIQRDGWRSYHCYRNRLLQGWWTQGGPPKTLSSETGIHYKLGEAYERKTFVEKGFAVKVNAVQTSTGAKLKAKRTNDPVRRKEIERLMKGKYYRCGEGHQTDQCSQKGSSLKCTACNRKCHIPKASYTEMLKFQNSKNQHGIRRRSGNPSPFIWGNNTANKDGENGNHNQHSFQYAALHSHGTSTR